MFNINVSNEMVRMQAISDLLCHSTQGSHILKANLRPLFTKSRFLSNEGVLDKDINTVLLFYRFISSEHMHKIARIIDLEIDFLLRIKDNDNPAGSFHDAIDCFKATSRTQLLALLETINPPTEMLGQIIDECMISIGNLAARRLGTDVLSDFVITTTSKSPINPQARIFALIATRQVVFVNVVVTANTSIFVNNRVGGAPGPGERPPRIPPLPPHRPPQIPGPQIPPPFVSVLVGATPKYPQFTPEK